MNSYEKIVDCFVEWGVENENVRAAIIVGSRARETKPADEWSDLDLVLFAKEPADLLYKKEWLSNFGNPQITFLEKTAVSNGTERRVLYEGGLDVDFSIFPAEGAGSLLESKEVQGVFARGVKVLFDKDGLFASLNTTAFELPRMEKPSFNEFENNVNDFWYHTVWTAKKLCRGELLVAKSCCDIYLKELLVTVVKWKVNIENNWEADTWHSKRFFEAWADPEVLEKFKTIYTVYDEDSLWEALFNTMGLYRIWAAEVAESLGFAYSVKSDQSAAELVVELCDVQRNKH